MGCGWWRYSLPRRCRKCRKCRRKPSPASCDPCGTARSPPWARCRLRVRVWKYGWHRTRVGSFGRRWAGVAVCGIRQGKDSRKHQNQSNPNFLGVEIVGSKIKREKGQASAPVRDVQCRAVPAIFTGDLQGKEALSKLLGQFSLCAGKRGRVPDVGAVNRDFLSVATVFMGVKDGA